MINWPDQLIRDLALRKCAIILGSGISANSTNANGRRPKTWEAFLEDIYPQLTNNKVKNDTKGLIKEKDFLTACELVKKDIGSNNFVDRLISEFHTPNYNPSEIHRQIHLLDQRIVITPNIDNIYERHAQHIDGTTIVKKFFDNDVAQSIRRLDQRLILKIHGSIENPNNVIFTRAEYANARSEYSRFYEIMDALAITHTFVFLGCGFNDPDIRLMLENYGYKFQYSNKHYFVSSNKSVRNNVFPILEETLNVQVLKYNPTNNHQELLNSIIELNQFVEAKRNEIAQIQSW